MDMSSASLSRLLRMLLDEGWVRNDGDGSYVAGAKLLQLGRHLNGHWSEHELVEPIVQRVALRTGHSSCFARFANDCFVLTAKTEMPSSYHFIDLFWDNRDLITNGMGMALLAYQEQEVAAFFIEEKAGAERVADLLDLLADIRRDGHYVSRENHVLRIMAPVRAGLGNRVKGLIAIAAIDPDNVVIDDCIAIVKAAAREAEQRLSSAERGPLAATA